jgi:hypothetical protein
MSSRRCKSRTMKFGIPLSVAGSRHVEHCYALHGAAYAHPAPDGAEIELVLVNAQRQLWMASGTRIAVGGYRTDAVGPDDGWMPGWRMADGSMPLGEYDVVDPELAQFDYLPWSVPLISDRWEV